MAIFFGCAVGGVAEKTYLYTQNQDRHPKSNKLTTTRKEVPIMMPRYSTIHRTAAETAATGRRRGEVVLALLGVKGGGIR